MINNEKIHFYWLDLIRFMAALIVVVAHARGEAFVEYGALASSDKSILVTLFYAITRIGNEAVVVFFVLSGFLVGGRAIERMVAGTFDPKSYAIDRFVRIFLPLMPALLLTGILTLYAVGHINILGFIGHLLSLQGVLVPVFEENGSLWSLAYEVWFYVLLYAVGIMIVNKFYHTSSIILIIFLLIFTALSPTYLFCWLIGAYAYVIRPTKVSIPLLLSAIMLVTYSTVGIQLGSDSISISPGIYNKFFPSLDGSRLLFSFGIAIAIQQLLLIKPNKTFFIRLDRIGTSLSLSSYTLYLTHYPLLLFLFPKRAEQITINSISTFIFSILFCLAASWILYLMFEKHTNIVRKFIKSKLMA